MSPPNDVLSEIADLSKLKKKIGNKGEIQSYFLNSPSGGLKLNQYGFDPMIQFGLAI